MCCVSARAGAAMLARADSAEGRSRPLDLLDLRRLLAATFLVVDQDERDLVALVERPDARRLQGGRMHEHILGAVLRRDKPEALGTVEELDRSVDPHRRDAFPLRVK